MKTRTIFIMVFLLWPIVLIPEESKTIKYKDFPVYSITSNFFEVKNVTFNKTIDPINNGEVLKVAFEVKNRIDASMDFFIFVIATYEKFDPIESSFKKPAPQRDIIRNFCAFPDNRKNFEYPPNDDEKKKGKKFRLEKFPKDNKLGTDPSTGKPYSLSDNLIIRTGHFTKFRKNYVFFNTITILLFDAKNSKEKNGIVQPVYRRAFKLIGKRR